MGTGKGRTMVCAGVAMLFGLVSASCEAAMRDDVSGRPAQTLSFADLDGWAADDQAAALAAFRRSCARILRLGDEAPLDGKGADAAFYGRAGDWRPACAAAAGVAAGAEAARAYFERWFAPVRFGAGADRPPLFTGYYEPEMKGALSEGGAYRTPILGLPPAFAEARAAGETLPTRAAIEDMLETGALDRANALVWLADPVDAFFLHVQGSGRVRLPDGRLLRLAFAAKNDRPYTSVGKLLIERGAIPRDEVSMQTIRAWLAAHPADVRPLLRRNESYIFFKRLDGVDPETGPPGAERVNLTPGRSLAVDRRFHPLGVLFWLETRAPEPYGPVRRLMVAQDTGTAIRGLQRADVFWGAGAEAAEIAGRMKEPGELIALVPKTLRPAADPAGLGIDVPAPERMRRE